MGIPGGKVEPGETFSAALQRELWEEVGLSPVIGEEMAVTRYRYPDRSVELHLFRCALTDGEPVALQAAAMRWVPIKLLCTYDFPPANAALLAAAGICRFL